MSFLLAGLMGATAFDWEAKVFSCKYAVENGDHSAALVECDTEGALINIFEPTSKYDSPLCAEALKAGRTWAENRLSLYGALGSAKRDFKKSMEDCLTPPVDATPVPVRKVPNLWD